MLWLGLYSQVSLHSKFKSSNDSGLITFGNFLANFTIDGVALLRRTKVEIKSTLSLLAMIFIYYNATEAVDYFLPTVFYILV